MTRLHQHLIKILHVVLTLSQKFQAYKMCFGSFCPSNVTSAFAAVLVKTRTFPFPSWRSAYQPDPESQMAWALLQNKEQQPKTFLEGKPLIIIILWEQYPVIGCCWWLVSVFFCRRYNNGWSQRCGIKVMIMHPTCALLLDFCNCLWWFSCAVMTLSCGCTLSPLQQTTGSQCSSPIRCLVFTLGSLF